jgi:hypothetical protein
MSAVKLVLTAIALVVAIVGATAFGINAVDHSAPQVPSKGLTHSGP